MLTKHFLFISQNVRHGNMTYSISMNYVLLWQHECNIIQHFQKREFPDNNVSVYVTTITLTPSYTFNIEPMCARCVAGNHVKENVKSESDKESVRAIV
jgi:hypothetical protein